MCAIVVGRGEEEFDLGVCGPDGEKKLLHRSYPPTNYRLYYTIYYSINAIR